MSKEAEQSKYSCAHCGKPVDDELAEIAIDCHEKTLCFKHQKEASDEREKRAPKPVIMKCENTLRNELMQQKPDLYLLQQKWDGYKHIDLTLPHYMLNIEVDGPYHKRKYKPHHKEPYEVMLTDFIRDYYSFRRGWVTIRVSNELVENKLEKTAHYILRFAEARRKQLQKITPSME